MGALPGIPFVSKSQCFSNPTRHSSEISKDRRISLRFLLYICDLYSALTRDANLYGTRKVPIPQPRFLVFYNGRREQPDQVTLRLSELYLTKEMPFFCTWL